MSLVGGSDKAYARKRRFEKELLCLHGIQASIWSVMQLQPGRLRSGHPPILIQIYFSAFWVYNFPGKVSINIPL